MERVDIVKLFIKKAVREGIIDRDMAEELNNFANWMDENLEFYKEA